MISGDLKRDFPQLQILQAVRAGRLDAGFVRADNVYKAELNNQTRQSYFRVLGQLNVSLPGAAGEPYPFPISTPLYPEWALSAFPVADSALRWAVISALLLVNASSPEAVVGNYDSWELALEYSSVLQALYSIRCYDN